MTFSMDFSNDKPDIREPIPAGTPLFLRMTFQPGGAGDGGALTASKPPSDTKYLKCEFTVLRGPFKGRKFWSNLTTEGGKVDEKGQSEAAKITRKTIRAILDSSQGLNSKDESPEAMAKRVITGFKDLQGREFFATTKVEPAQNGYPAKNGLGTVLTPGMTKETPTTLDGFLAMVDKPVVAGSPVKEAPAAPAWGAAATAAPAPTQNATVAPVAQPQAATAPAPANNDAIPNWAKPAA